MHGVSAISSLKNLDISNNLIEIIVDIVRLNKLEVLNLSSNRIDNFDQIVNQFYKFIFEQNGN